MSQPHDFPFDITDVAELLHLRIRRPSPQGFYVDCPICNNNIHEWFSVEENRILWEELKPMVNIEKIETAMSVVQDNPFVGKTLVVTGKVEPYTRDGINAKIYSLGAKAGSSVSKNTDYLICGENAGSKLAKAQALGVAVLSPAEFFRMIGE